MPQKGSDFPPFARTARGMVCAIALCFAGLILSNAAPAQTPRTARSVATQIVLPAEIRSALDRRHPGWRLYDIDIAAPGEREHCNTKPQWGSVVRGDFDGDSQTDYGVLVVQKRNAYALAFLRRAHGYQLFDVDPSTATRTGSANFLVLRRRGSIIGDMEHERQIQLKNDGLTVISCEVSIATYRFEHGMFIAAFESD